MVEAKVRRCVPGKLIDIVLQFFPEARSAVTPPAIESLSHNTPMQLKVPILERYNILT